MYNQQAVSGVSLAMRYADEAVIVTISSFYRCATSTASLECLILKTVKAERGERMEKHILITRYDLARASRGEMLSNGDDILERIPVPLSELF